MDVSEVLIAYLTNRGMATVMLNIWEGHSNNWQIILQLFGMTYFAISCSPKKFQANFGGFKFINPFPVCVPVWVPGENMMKNWKFYFNLKIVYAGVN